MHPRRHHTTPFVCLGMFVLSIAGAPGAVMSAQQPPPETRAGLIERAQQEKAANLKRFEPNRAEALVMKVEGILLSSPSGLYPYFDSVWSGGGFTLGAGVRRFYGDDTYWDLKGLYSAKNYKLIDLSTRTRQLADGRLDAGVSAGWRDATQVGYFGLGSATSEADRARYGFTQGWIGADARLRAARWAVFGIGAGYEDFTLKAGAGNDPSIEEIYTPETAPGLGANPTYIHTEASAGIDWRPSAGYARRGGLYEIRYHNYADRDAALSFDRIDADIVQHIPILRETWVVSLHGLLQTTIDGEVPYFLMPSLGGGSTLRGFDSWRFRDRHALLMQAEWRWIPNRYGIDMALFFDAGKVASTRGGLDFDDLATDYGIGFRLHSLVSTPLRIELARSHEGIRLVFGGSATF